MDTGLRMTASESHLPRHPVILGHFIAGAMSADEPNTRIENILQWQPIEGPCSLQYVASIVPVSLDKSSHDLTSCRGSTTRAS